MGFDRVHRRRARRVPNPALSVNAGSRTVVLTRSRYYDEEVMPLLAQPPSTANLSAIIDRLRNRPAAD